MPDPYWDIAGQVWIWDCQICPPIFLSVPSNILLVMQSMGKHRRPVAVEIIDIAKNLI